MKLQSRFLLASLAFAIALTFAPTANAQKLGKDWFEDTQNGYRFRYLKKWKASPVQSHEKARGLVTKMDGGYIAVRSGDSKSISFPVEMNVMKLENRAKGPETGADAAGGLRGRLKAEKGREDIADVIEQMYGSLRDYEKNNPIVDELEEFKDFEPHHRTWKAFTGDIDILIDTWTFSLVDYDICLLFLVPDEKSKKYLKEFAKSAKTFEEIPIEKAVTIDESSSYEDRLAYHAYLHKDFPEWQVLPTPSKRFIITTSSNDEKFLDEAIERLERSRDVFERDFPPTEDFDHVSVVRICRSREEFHQYGNTQGGVAGWFNPSSTELVLFDGKNIDRNMTYAVMSHEGFHQYCHFLFKESEAHRWFDEGHGDYYGGAEIRGKRVEITPKMPAGLDRLTVIREMVREESYAPIEEHLNFNHSKWQNQGPSGVSCYAQSWSIVYMLRQGALGNVHRKVWKDEYANIIPNYVSTLFEGFQKKYDEIREQRKKDAKEENRELTDEDLKVNRNDLTEDEKTAIWKKAMEASWGDIDFAEFEENWKLYVKKYLK